MRSASTRTDRRLVTGRAIARRLSRYHFWRGVGEHMGLTVPQTREQFLAWTYDYEDPDTATLTGAAPSWTNCSPTAAQSLPA